MKYEVKVFKCTFALQHIRHRDSCLVVFYSHSYKLQELWQFTLWVIYVKLYIISKLKPLDTFALWAWYVIYSLICGQWEHFWKQSFGILGDPNGSEKILKKDFLALMEHLKIPCPPPPPHSSKRRRGRKVEFRVNYKVINEQKCSKYNPQNNRNCILHILNAFHFSFTWPSSLWRIFISGGHFS